MAKGAQEKLDMGAAKRDGRLAEPEGKMTLGPQLFCSDFEVCHPLARAIV